MNDNISFLFCRKAGALLLAATLLPCLAVARAGEADWSSAGPGMLSSASAGQPQIVSAGYSSAPGTPYPFTNPGGSTIIIGYNAYSAQPAPVKGNNIAFDISSVVAGDIVMLRNPAGSNDPSNWAAVFRFLSLDDPTGANGLPADKIEGFDATNTGPGGFAAFKLFPNAIYAADKGAPPSGHIATATELGGGGTGTGLFPGQTAILIYTVNVPEPATGTGVLAGAGFLALVLSRRAGACCRPMLQRLTSR